ncbi:MAG: adventurous gliding motility lipoprotein CglB [Myxococcales bacterium]|nr:adventurous gliding motility lipoprotein CglB [Myxococcales bacterium]
MRWFITTLLLTLSTACGRTTLPCEPSTCSGCCDGYGNCQAGTVNEECGVGAKGCVFCARGATCTQGLCLGGMSAGGASGTGGGRAGGAAAGGAAGGVSPGAKVIGARTFVPDVMLVVDRSGSMQQSLNPMDPQCRGCTTNCPPGCLTRSQALLTSMERFLSTSGTDARFGLVLFPSNASCGAPSVVSPPIPMSDDASVLAMNASAATTQLRSTSFSGGTPTSLALRFAAADSAFTLDTRREHFMVLVSDGVPNCNPSNPATCMTPQTCQCTIATCAGQNCVIGCLDRQAALDALTLAKTKDISTFVVGFGPDATTEVFNALAVAGGRPLTCSQALNECGTGNACSAAGSCSRQFSNELGAGLSRVGEVARRSGTCRFVLDEAVAVDPRLEVRVNGLVVSRGADGWQAERADVVRFGNTVCAALTSTPGTQVTFTLMP